MIHVLAGLRTAWRVLAGSPAACCRGTLTVEEWLGVLSDVHKVVTVSMLCQLWRGLQSALLSLPCPHTATDFSYILGR